MSAGVAGVVVGGWNAKMPGSPGWRGREFRRIALEFRPHSKLATHWSYF